MTIPGFTFNYTDPNSGANYPSSWIIISESKQDTPTTSLMSSRVAMRYDVYLNQNAFTSTPRKVPVSQSNAYIVSNSDSSWATYFTESVMMGANHSLMTQSYAALQSYLSSLT